MYKILLALWICIGAIGLHAQQDSSTSYTLEHYLKNENLSQAQHLYKQLNDSTLINHPEWQKAMIDLLLMERKLDSALLDMERFIEWHKEDRKEEVLEMKRKQLKVEGQILMREKALFEVHQNKNYYKALKFIDAFPTYPASLHLQDSLDYYKDFTYFNYCYKYKRAKACKNYLDDYPEGRFRKEAIAMYDSLDYELYQRILHEGNHYDMYSYFTTQTYGHYRAEIKSLYHDSLLQYILRTPYTRDIEKFIEYFPRDSMRPIIDSLLDESYYNFIVEDYEEKKWNWASRHADDYLDKFPEGIHKEEAKHMLIKSRRMANLTYKEYDHWFLLFGYDSDPAFSLSIGRLTNGFSFYNRLRFFPLRADTHRINIHEHPTGPFDRITPIKSIQQEVFSFSAGAKYNPYNQPIWFYASIGVGVYEQVQEFAGYNRLNGNLVFVENQYFTYGGSRVAFIPEVGVICALGKTVLLNYGLLHNGKHFVHELGIGFALHQDILDSSFSSGGTGNNKWMDWLWMGGR
jgi:hypothetical protein